MLTKAAQTALKNTSVTNWLLSKAFTETLSGLEQVFVDKRILTKCVRDLPIPYSVHTEYEEVAFLSGKFWSITGLCPEKPLLS